MLNWVYNFVMVGLGTVLLSIGLLILSIVGMGFSEIWKRRNVR